MSHAAEHPVPVFGCAACVAGDRAEIMRRAAQETARPPCPDCKGPTVLYDANSIDMTLSFTCASMEHDGHGVPLCEGWVDIKIK